MALYQLSYTGVADGDAVGEATCYGAASRRHWSGQETGAATAVIGRS
jgi:hypothetical protein